MDWVTENDLSVHGGEADTSVVGGHGDVASGSAIIAHEIFEDQARQEFDAALKLIRENQHFAAKKRLEKLLITELPDTPFRARLFRAALKNLARCHLAFSDSESALKALVAATTHLDRDDRDISLWLMIRRVARDVAHLPLLKLAEAVLDETVPKEDFVPLPPPIECKMIMENAGDELGLSTSVLITIPDAEELSWSKFLECIAAVGLSEVCSIVAHKRTQPALPDDDVPQESQVHLIEEVQPSEVSVTNEIKPESPNGDSEHIADSNSLSPSQETPKRKKRERARAEFLTRMTKRQLMMSQEESEQITVSEVKEEIDVDGLLPQMDMERWQELHSWFLVRLSVATSADSRSGSPVNSPIMFKPANLTREQELRSLVAVVHSLQSLHSITGYNLLQNTFSFAKKEWQFMPPESLAELYELLVSRGVQLTPEERWIGTLAVLESTDTIDDKSPSEWMETEGNLQSEIFVLENALNSDSYELASRTLKRCVERARRMKRPLLAKLALDRLEEFGNLEDSAFILYQRDRLEKSSAHERIDTILDECAILSPAFTKNPEACLRKVYEVCKEESRLSVFLRYSLDVLKHGLSRKDESICRSTLFRIVDAQDNIMEIEGNNEEGAAPLVTSEEIESAIVHVARLYPSLLARFAVESILSGLWVRVLPALWVWASENRTESAVCLEYLKTTLAEDYVSISETDRNCILHAMFKCGALRSALLILLQITVDTPKADWISNQIELCEYAVSKDPTSADVAFRLLLRHPSIIRYFQIDVDNLQQLDERSNVIGDKGQSSDDQAIEDDENDSLTERHELEFQREEALNECAQILWGGPVFNQEDVPILWEFVAPHLWADTNCTGVKFPDKKKYLEKLLPFVSIAPATETIAQIEAGGMWFHLVRLDEEKAVENWLERDLKVEPQRLTTLFMIGKLRYRAEKLDECVEYLSEIEKFVERRYPIPLKAGALVEVVGPSGEFQPETAVVARVYQGIDHDMDWADLYMVEEERVHRAVPKARLRQVPQAMMADVLPDQLDTFLIDVNEYLALVRYAQNDLGLDKGVETSINLCEKVNDNRAWSFYWLMGCISGDEARARKCFEKAHSMSLDLLVPALKKKNAPKNFQNTIYSYKVAVSETKTRLCALDIQEMKSGDSDLKERCLEKLKEALELDSYNIGAARLLQELSGNESTLLESTFNRYVKQKWRTDFFLYDEVCIRERDDEVKKALFCLLEALRDRPNPVPTVLAILDHYRLKRIKDHQDDVLAFVLEDALPRLDLENVYLVNLSIKHPAVKKKSDARLLELGAQEFKLNTLPEILDACRSKWKHHDQSKTSKLFKSGVSSTAPSSSKASSGVSGNATPNTSAAVQGGTDSLESLEFRASSIPPDAADN